MAAFHTVFEAQRKPQPLPTPEIVEQLIVSANTVRTHVKNIYGKLGVHGRSQAVSRARALGLLA